MISKLENNNNGKLNDQPEIKNHKATSQKPHARARTAKTLRNRRSQMSPTDADGRSRTVKNHRPTSGVRIFDRRLSGKVAALPKDVREIVNTTLDDGHSYDEIVEKLTELGYPDFNVKNISRWKLNGYEQWLRRQEQLDEIKLRTESMLEMAQNFQRPIQRFNDSTVQRFNMAPTLGEKPLPETEAVPTGQDILDGFWSVGEGLLAMEVVEALMESSHAELSLEEKGKLISRIGRVVAANRRERTRTAKQNLEERKYADERHDLFAPPPPRKKRDLEEPLTQEEREAIVHKVDELFGIKLKVPKVGRVAPRAPSAEPLQPGARGATRPTLPIIETADLRREPADVLPLPKGEGRGEGEETIQTPSAVPESPDSPEAPPQSASPSDVHPVHPVHPVHSVPSPNSTERAGTPSNAPELSDEQNPPANLKSKIVNLNSLPNPNAVGEWPQPPGTIPVINVLGCIVGWAAHPEIPHSPDLTLRDPAANKAEPIQVNQKTVLWYHRNSQVRNCPTRYPIRGRAHFIPVINADGQVIDWREWDDEWFVNLPPQNPRPLLTDSFRGQIIAWINE